MSRNWKFEQAQSRALTPARRASWPEGATVGVLLVAAACFGVTATLYHIAGPRDVFVAVASAE